MRAIIRRTLDSLIPPDIKEFEQGEEMVRARSVVFFNLVNLVLSIIILLGTAVTGNISDDLRMIVPYTMSAAIVANAFAIWIFYSSGLYSVAGNIYALTIYGTTMASVMAAANPKFIYLMIPMLSLPVIVSLVANHVSAIVWLVIITLSPELISYFGTKPVDIHFSGTYLGACFGLFLALYMENFYRENMRQRLNAERTHFEFAAAHDALTGIPNRATFDRRLQECIDFCLLHDSKAVLIYIDLDQFKPINDTYGHQAGDIVLTTVANRLRHLVRSSDTVARLGGDEFAILFEQCDPARIDPIVDRVGAVIREPIAVFDNSLSVDCSIGKVVCPDDGLHPEQLSHKADERMYKQKRGENGNRASASAE